MVGDKAVWRKCWLESRTRFFVVAVVIICVLVWQILDSQHRMGRFDRRPPLTFSQYVAFVFAGGFQTIWVGSVLFLGLGGIVREAALGTAALTLTLPFRRRDWMGVRATLGLLQAGALAFIPVAVIPICSLVVHRSYPPWEALKFSGLLFAGGYLFFFLGFFWSALLGSELSGLAAAGVSLLLVFAAQDYLYRWFPSFNFPNFNMSAFLSGGDLVNRTTGFLEAWPWAALVKCFACAVFLFWASVEIVDRRDF